MADTNQILRLAAIIREVDGTHSKGAASLAESIFNHPDFRAALADGPAVPAPTVMEIIELSEEVEAAGLGQVDFARAVLARWGNPAPTPPADGEVAKSVAWLRQEFMRNQQIGNRTGALQSLRAAELLQRQALVPVSVSERLPGPSDCAPWPKDSDASAWCWVGTDQDDGWNWEQRSAGCLAMFPDDFTHWLPAHALPLPEVSE